MKSEGETRRADRYACGAVERVVKRAVETASQLDHDASWIMIDASWIMMAHAAAESDAPMNGIES